VAASVGSELLISPDDGVRPVLKQLGLLLELAFPVMVQVIGVGDQFALPPGVNVRVIEEPVDVPPW
jgi:hypothetical protein